MKKGGGMERGKKGRKEGEGNGGSERKEEKEGKGGNLTEVLKSTAIIIKRNKTKKCIRRKA